jgi:hypothetical protein
MSDDRSLGRIKWRHPDGSRLTNGELIPLLNEMYDRQLAVLHQRNRDRLLESDLEVDQIFEHLMYLDAANEGLRGDYLQQALAFVDFVRDSPDAVEH